MCLEARILTCGHEYHIGSLIISFCTSLRPPNYRRLNCLNMNKINLIRVAFNFILAILENSKQQF